MYASYVHHFILVAQSTHFSSNDAAYGGVFIMKDSEFVEKAEIWQWLMQGVLSSRLCYADEFPFYFWCICWILSILIVVKLRWTQEELKIWDVKSAQQ